MIKVNYFGAEVDDAENTVDESKPALAGIVRPQVGGHHYEQFSPQPYERNRTHALQQGKPEKYIGYCQFQASDYIARHDTKGGISDLEKAIWWLNELITFENELEISKSGDNQ